MNSSNIMRKDRNNMSVEQIPRVFARCWTCSKEYEITRWSMRNGVKCDAPGCDGYVISPSGKIQGRISGDFSQPPAPLFKAIGGEQS